MKGKGVVMSKRLLGVVVFGIFFFAVSSFAQEGRRIREQAQPVLPAVAVEMHLSGVVRLQVTILPSGFVRDVKIMGGHPMLADAAVKAVQTWQWDVGKNEVKTVAIEFKKKD
jgi:TonB family protein